MSGGDGETRDPSAPTFDGELGYMSVGPCLRRNSRERVVFPDILDVILEVGWMSVDRLRVPIVIDLPLEATTAS